MRLSPHLFATMASADCSGALTPELSPDKLSALSKRAGRLYLMRLGGLWASPVPRQLAARTRPPLPVRVPTVAPLPCTSFGSRPRGLLLALRLRLPPPVPMTSFHVISSDPCRAHEGSCLQLLRGPPSTAVESQQVRSLTQAEGPIAGVKASSGVGRFKDALNRCVQHGVILRIRLLDRQPFHQSP